MIVFGARMFGKVDEVPGLFHVATRCAHIWYIPLLPMGGSMILLESGGKVAKAVPIPLDSKSMLTAWVRGGLIVGTFLALIFGVKQLTDPRPNATLGIALLCLVPVLIAAAVMSWRLRFVTHATYERAVHLAQKAGFNEEGLVMIEVAYGRVSAEEAAPVLAQLREDAEKMAELRASAAPPIAPPMAPVRA